MAGRDSSDELSLRERLRRRREDRRERRAWRRERRKSGVNPYDAANQAESSMAKGGFFSSNPTNKD